MPFHGQYMPLVPRRVLSCVLCVQVVVGHFNYIFCVRLLQDVIYLCLGEPGRSFIRCAPPALSCFSAGRCNTASVFVCVEICVLRAQVVVAAAVTGSTFDELFYFNVNPASFGLAGRNENELCGADYGAERDSL